MFEKKRKNLMIHKSLFSGPSVQTVLKIHCTVVQVGPTI